ncbi:hypothetical protein MEME101129_22285 [Methylobacterium mesophilicum]|jgi:hypothetical protein
MAMMTTEGLTVVCIMPVTERFLRFISLPVELH